jgi:uncharacterized membrane protein YoaK (UPF0700 family)
VLLGNQSISYYSPSNLAIWMLMAFQAGLINIGGFMAGHHIVSHVTGFATFFGYEMTKEGRGEALGMFIIPFFFLVGAMISGYFVDIRLKLNKKPKYYITFGIIFVLILIVFISGVTNQFGKFGVPTDTQRNYFLLFLLCLICGIQNGTISTVSKSIVRTTHLTGITTDLGLGVVRLIFREKLKDHIKGEGQANLMRLGIIFSFVLGSVLGGFLFKEFGFVGFSLPLVISGSLFVLMLYFQIWKNNRIQVHEP